MNSFRYLLAAFLLAALAPAPSRAQDQPQEAPPPPPDHATKYERSEQGLLTQLHVILSNAKDPEKTKLFVQALELPKYDNYFHAVYQADVELFWMASYKRAMMQAKTSFRSLFARLATEDGEFHIRRVNDAPASKLEQAFLAKLNGPVDVYAVSWRKRKAADDSGDDLLGYYAYLSGRFHWLYVLGYPKTAAEAAASEAKPATKPSAGASNAPEGASAGSTIRKSGSSSAPSQPTSQQ